MSDSLSTLNDLLSMLQQQGLTAVNVVVDGERLEVHGLRPVNPVTNVPLTGGAGMKEDPDFKYLHTGFKPAPVKKSES